jgi:5-methylcytosine-specific restriction endonuclease McrA
MVTKTLSRKRRQKLLDGRCLFCHETDASVLDAHRIVPGELGGRYTRGNVLTLCANCHRQTHSREIILDRIYLSTRGPVLHCWVNRKECWLPVCPV